MVAALQSGEIDLMQNVPLDAVEPLRAGRGIKIIPGRGATHGQLAMRVDMKPFDDKRVRQALALTIDREKVVQNLWSGLADVGNDHIIAPSYPIAAHVKVPQRKQDYDQAKRLLAEAGYPNGIDVELFTHPNRSLPSYAQVIQDMARPAGIRIKLTIEPSDVYYKHWNEVPLGMENWGHRPSPGQLLNLAYRCGGNWNVPHWCNQQFDALVTELDATLDEQNRGEIANRIASLMHEETPAIIAYFEQTVKATNSRVNGVAGEATDYLDLRSAWLA
jgi:peptide/nickel transport system substrate-binding protein